MGEGTLYLDRLRTAWGNNDGEGQPLSLPVGGRENQRLFAKGGPPEWPWVYGFVHGRIEAAREDQNSRGGSTGDCWESKLSRKKNNEKRDEWGWGKKIDTIQYSRSRQRKVLNQKEKKRGP